MTDRLARIPQDEDRVLMATGKYIGEGFDDPRFDTLFVALPVSWRGTVAAPVCSHVPARSYSPGTGTSPAGSDYNTGVDPREIERFVRRDWEGAAALKSAHWPERFRRNGWREVWNAAQSLLLHVRAVRPDFPTAREREEDFEHHLTLKSRLDRAAHAFPRP